MWQVAKKFVVLVVGLPKVGSIRYVQATEQSYQYCTVRYGTLLYCTCVCPC